MWLDWLVFCDYGFSVSALWCPLTTLTILLGFLLPWIWGISSWLLQQSAATAPYLGRGVSPHGRPSWPWTWSSSSRPSCARAAAAPWTWGCSSRPPAPDLRHNYFALLDFTEILFFFFFLVWNEGLYQPFYSAIFPIAFAYFVFLYNILIIISVFQTFPLLLDFLCDLLSVTFDVTIAERLQLTKGSDG